jgi:hypothetical protein
LDEHPTPSDAIHPLLRLATGFWLSQALYVAARLGVADHLAEGPRTAAELAAAAGAHEDALGRILLVLAGAGVLTRDAQGRFGLSALGEPLASQAPSSLRPYVLFLGSRPSWRAWGELAHSAATGEPAFDKAFGRPIFEHLAGHDEDAAVFDAAMAGRSRLEDPAVAEAYDWPAGTVVDVGGGRGGQLAAVLQRAPQARGILVDMPHVVPAAARHFAEAGIADRCEAVASDIFREVPKGAAVYLMKKVIHDWDDERAAAILRCCRAAMARDGRVVVVEHVLPPGPGLSWARLTDLQMLVLTSGGRERTEAEYRSLFASAGLVLTRVIPTAAGVSLVEGAIAP